MKAAEPDLSEREQINLLLAVIYDFASDESSRIVEFLDHIGFDLAALNKPRDLLDALPAFYRVHAGRYDVNRLERDLISWEPIATAVAAAEEEQRQRRAGPSKQVWTDDL